MITLQDTNAIRRIESAIGYTFRDKRLLVQVFTRKTYMKVDPEAPDNEVLEFYGDTLMSYHVTTYFVEKFAHMLNDGLYFMRTVEQFTEMRSHYVRNQYLTDRIKQLIPNIDRLLRAQNPRTELPKDNQKAYADLFESLIGAVYLDSYRDDDLIRAFILKHLDIEPKHVDTSAQKSSRTVVLPSVSLLDDEPARIPPEEPALSDAMAVEIETPEADDEPAPALPVTEPVTEALEETADSTAAVEAPVPEVVEAPAEPEVPTPMQDELAAFCLDAGYEAPVFGETPKNAPNARPVAACTVRFRNKRGKPVKISLNDSGKTISEATEKAAAKMLKKLREQKSEEEAKAAEAVMTAEPAPAEVPVAEEPTPETVVAPAEPAPAEEVPAEVAPAEEAPAEIVPETVTPEAPAENSAAENSPAEETAPAEVPTDEVTVPAEAAPVPEEPAAKKPASRRRKAPAKATEKAEAPVTETPVEIAVEPAAEMPVEPTPAKKPAPRRRKAPAKAAAEAETPAAEAAPAPAETPVTDAPAESEAEGKKAPAKHRRRAPAKKKADTADGTAE